MALLPVLKIYHLSMKELDLRQTFPAELRCCIDVEILTSKEALVLFQSLSLTENILSQISCCRQAMSTEAEKKSIKPTHTLLSTHMHCPGTFLKAFFHILHKIIFKAALLA